MEGGWWCVWFYFTKKNGKRGWKKQVENICTWKEILLPIGNVNKTRKTEPLSRVEFFSGEQKFLNIFTN